MLGEAAQGRPMGIMFGLGGLNPPPIGRLAIEIAGGIIPGPQVPKLITESLCVFLLLLVELNCGISANHSCGASLLLLPALRSAALRLAYAKADLASEFVLALTSDTL